MNQCHGDENTWLLGFDGSLCLKLTGSDLELCLEASESRLELSISRVFWETGRECCDLCEASSASFGSPEMMAFLESGATIQNKRITSLNGLSAKDCLQ